MWYYKYNKGVFMYDGYDSPEKALEILIASLIKEDMFYGLILSRMRKRYEPSLPAPCGVSITEHINLHINVDIFWGEFTLEERIDLLKHEVEHILKLHVTRSKNYDKKTYNIAADITINDHLCKGLQEKGMCSEKFGFEPDLTSEEYYELVKDNMEKNKQNGEGQGQGEGQNGEEGGKDVHITWEESHSKSASESVIEQEISKTIESVKKNGLKAGNIPSDALIALSRIASSSVDWRREVRKFTKKIISRSVRKIRTKLNRRYGLLAPGKKRKWTSHIAIAIDTSASVSEKELSIFFGEIVSLKNNSPSMKITIIEADAGIQRVYEFDKHSPFTVKGRGGTAYQPAFDKASELDVDGVVYFGDMDAADRPKEPKYPVLWCIVGSSNPPADFGRFVRIQYD